MNDLNQVTLIGRVVRDAELLYSQSGSAYAKFAIALNKSVKSGETWTDKAIFIDLAIFGKTAENVTKYLTKGAQVAVTGSLDVDKWEKDGQKHSKLTVKVDQVQLIGVRKEQTGQTIADKDNQDQGAVYQDDIPW